MSDRVDGEVYLWLWPRCRLSWVRVTLLVELPSWHHITVCLLGWILQVCKWVPLKCSGLNLKIYPMGFSSKHIDTLSLCNLHVCAIQGDRIAFSFLIELLLVIVGIRIRWLGGSLSSNTQVGASREMVRDGITGSPKILVLRLNLWLSGRSCFVKTFFFFSLGKARRGEFRISVPSMLRASIDGDVHIFPRDLSILGVMVGQLPLNLPYAHQNHLGD